MERMSQRKPGVASTRQHQCKECPSVKLSVRDWLTILTVLAPVIGVLILMYVDIQLVKRTMVTQQQMTDYVSSNTPYSREEKYMNEAMIEQKTTTKTILARLDDLVSRQIRLEERLRIQEETAARSRP